MSDDVQRELGALEARMDAVESRLEKIEAKLDQVVTFMAQTKGGWRTLAGVAAAAATIGAAVSRLLEWRGP